MWPLSRRGDLLRVTRGGVERWTRGPLGWTRLREASFAEGEAPSLSGLAGLLSTALVGAPRSVDVIVESAWLPVMMVETGAAVWSRSSVEALARHRMTELHDDRGPVHEALHGTTAAAWSYVVDHRPGDECGVAYGLPPALRASIEQALATAGVRPASLQPGLSWGWSALASRRTRTFKRDGWWIWLERDRAIVCRTRRGRIVALNAGAALSTDWLSLGRAVRFEMVRLGLSGELGPVALAGWQLPAGPSTEGDFAVCSLAERGHEAPSGTSHKEALA